MSDLSNVTIPNTQRLLLLIYIIGVIASISANFICYPGTIIGKVGWSLIWFIYYPALITRYLLFFTDLNWGSYICPGPIAMLDMLYL